MKYRGEEGKKKERNEGKKYKEKGRQEIRPENNEGGGGVAFSQCTQLID